MEDSYPPEVTTYLTKAGIGLAKNLNLDCNLKISDYTYFNTLFIFGSC